MIEEEIKPEIGYEPTEEERALITSLTDDHLVQARNKIGLERAWFTNIAFLLGRHDTVWNQNTLATPFKAHKWSYRYICNLILAYYRRTLSMLSRNRPVMWVAPATNEQEDIDIAQLSELFLDAKWQALDMLQRIKRAVRWQVSTGSVFFHPYWDKTQGRIISDDGTREGDIALDIVSPFEIEFDTSVSKFEDTQWVMRVKAMPLTWIRENFENGKYVAKEDVWLYRFHERRLLEFAGVQSLGGESIRRKEVDTPQALVIERWQKPDKKYPKGRHIIVANGVLLLNEDNEWEDWLPFIPAYDIQIPGRPWGQALIEHLIDINKNYNRARSQMIEHRNLLYRPKLIRPVGCKLKASSLTSEPGEVIDVVSAAHAPFFLTPPSNNMYFEREALISLKDFEETSGWHELSRGMVPANVRSGVTITLAREADETQLFDTASSLEEAIKKVAIAFLQMAHKYYTEPRLISVVGEEGYVESMTFKGKDLIGKSKGANYFDIRVEVGSLLAKSRYAKRQEIFDLIGMGVLKPDDPMHRRRIFQMLSMGMAEVDEVKQDSQFQKYEIKMMEKGKEMLVRDFDDHQVHYNETNKYRKSFKYLNLPPAIKHLLDIHAESHKIMLERQMQQMLAQQSALAPQGAAQQKKPPLGASPIGVSGIEQQVEPTEGVMEQQGANRESFDLQRLGG